MGLDIFVYYMQIPVLIASLALVIASVVMGKPREPLPHPVTRLGMRRIILGLTGVLFVCVLLAIVVALRGTNLPLPGEIAYLSTLFIPIGLCAFILIDIPLLAFLAKYGYANHLMILLITIIVGILWASVSYFSPYNNWCAANNNVCAIREFLYAAGFLGITGIAFGWFARLPFWNRHS